MNTQTTQDKAPNPLATAWSTLRAWFLGGLLAAGIAGVLAAPVLPEGQVTLQESGVAPNDIRAPERASYTSDILTQQARETAAASVTALYTPPDPTIARAQVALSRQILDFIRAVRTDPLATPSEKIAALQAIEKVRLSRDIIEQILAHSNTSWGRVEAEIITVIDLAMRSEIRDTTLGETRARVPALVGLDLSSEEARVVGMLVAALIAPNSFLDVEATTAAQDKARLAVKDVTRGYEAGQIVVREGAVVTALELEALKNLGLLQSRVEWTDHLGHALLALLVTLIIVQYVCQFEPELCRRPRHQLLLIVLGLGYLAMAKVIIPGRTVLPYLLPSPAVAMVLAVMISPTMAGLVAVMLGVLIGTVGGGSLELAAYTCGGGLAAALVLSNAERLNAFFRAGLYSALISAATVLAFRLPAGGTDSLGLAMLMGSGIIAGLISAALALALLFIIGALFDVTTTLQLIELTRPTHPLLNQLLMQATGTYHHTLMVANLAEQAAENIGANALRTRVGALYHDVGKMARSYMFVENQIGMDNVHERLDPRTSADLIMSHVKDGMDLARRYRLPSCIRAFIPEHHGTMRVSFLYQKALEQVGGDASQVDEHAFRYPGPKPQSKETALLMLADGCEAAARAARPQTPEELEQIIRKIINARVADGQLDECPLTLHDLDTIRTSFTHTLQGVFHPRIPYPEKQAPADDGQPGEAHEALDEGSPASHTPSVTSHAAPPQALPVGHESPA
ncbi:MAG: HDIG domain-containing protein [Thermoflexales bacterium]|nr:HDIG domain-containing protein [Thermoflexales bacterium]